MKFELQSACNFLVHRIRLTDLILEDKLDELQNALVNVLARRYKDHWFPEKPFKGSGYRCIRINPDKLDPVIVQAGEICGLDPLVIHLAFPQELTMWIDPLEVTCRISENGPIKHVYEFDEENPYHFWSLESINV